MDKTLENTVDTYFGRKKSLSRNELIHAILKDYPSLTLNTINVYLSKLKKQGILINPSRGIYSISKKADFHPEIAPPLKKVYNKIHQALPYVSCCIWDSRWLNSFMRHQTFKQYIVIEVEKVAMSQVFNIINEFSDHGYMDPNTLIFDLYITNSDEAIIIRPLVSEAPLATEKKVAIPTLEKLLIDMLADKDLFAAQQGELDFIFKTAFEKFQINTSKMNRYALRRNRLTELNNMLNIISAK
ncbi:DUF6577 family protein [Flavobacterium caeni]|uniref:Uncharacterized protein n=1 Tax=Flavobacterium caeni TaxID=490189 RepID=A0A1G5K848_9FLAO|nr:DUF6577 family protein [Flavobacterium caeni]SCY96188.1 hypothetical protein SAMN02927903_03108 [Flavobacterium caeni]